MKINNVNFAWWGFKFEHWHFGVDHWPHGWFKPLFYSFCIGPFEFRFWNREHGRDPARVYENNN
jgi:hypothetical protein